METKSNRIAQLLIRFAAAGNMLVHGITRLAINGVVPFDEYLITKGFPPYTAWAITFFEIAAALLIIGGKWVSILSILFCAQLIAGIVLLHFNEGWFVVGAGRNGMEYSVLLVICFISTAIIHQNKKF
jgi:putative oxidoreductase